MRPSSKIKFSAQFFIWAYQKCNMATEGSALITGLDNRPNWIAAKAAALTALG
jgi:hypothetical protein